MNVFTSLLFILLFLGCGKVAEKSSKTKQNVSALFSSSTLTVKVHYEPGAEPYTNNSPSPFHYWTILEQNLQALFSGRALVPQIVVPKTLTQMNLLPLSGDLSWSINDVLELAQRNQNSSSGVVFNIFFVNGHAAEGANIIGFHVSNTTTMVIFKDVIRNTSQGGVIDPVPKYVEQATVIHEMGHALGLVNNGVPMKENHQDSAHGAHCSNPDCVMFYSNEGAQGLSTFAQRIVQTQSLVMFDDECLNDTRSY